MRHQSFCRFDTVVDVNIPLGVYMLVRAEGHRDYYLRAGRRR
jgi:hypothetical protein